MQDTASPNPQSDSAAPYATFDYSELPLVRIEVTGVSANDQNFLAYLDEIYSTQEKNNYEPVATIFDVKKMTYLASKYRIMMGRRVEAEKENILKYAVGTAVITKNVIQDVIVKGILLVSPHPTPVKVFSKEKEGIKWLNELLEERKQGNVE